MPRNKPERSIFHSNKKYLIMMIAVNHQPALREATLCIQYKSPPGFAKSDFTRLKCASGKCNYSLVYKRPDAEHILSSRINFYDYQKLPLA
mmetsp:Transcript_259/g.638  ORF Transcript_259/g.638 Transcript_259/m.638 type:complete len:91 (-) Transcript_259:461-733(-)